jgi:Zn-dependent peptidase ImmA (M78 family)
VRKKNIVTVEDEVLAKLDTLIEKAEVVLDMFPNNMHIHVVLLETSKEVSDIFRRKYRKKASHIAYYSLSEDTIYISVDDARLRVLAHEIGHAVVDHYFKIRPPYNIHELMAQFTEKHITD